MFFESNQKSTIRIQKSKIMTKTLSSSIIVMVLVLVLVLVQSESRDRHVIEFKSPGLYPEGLTYDPTSQYFIVGSLQRRTLHSISDAGVIETLTSSTSDLPENSMILGLAVDNRRNRLLAAVNSDGGPYLASFSLQRSSIALIFLSPLPTASPATAVANDVTVDPYGNAYVTNSGESFIWKVTVDGKSSILSNSSRFHESPVDRSSPYSYCGLNGVVYIPGREYLLVVQSNTGLMFKVDIHDGTARSVILSSKLTLPDGITVRKDGVVIVVSMNNAWMLKSDDSWSEGVVTDKIALDREGFPTSVCIGGGGRVYVVYGYVEEAMAEVSDRRIRDETVLRESFRIEEIWGKNESDGELVWPFVLIGFGLIYFLFWRFQMANLVKNMDKKHS